MDVFEKVKEIIVSELSVDENEVTREARIIEDLGADSLSLVELMMGIETAFKEFDVEISEEEAQKLPTVGDIVDFLQTKLD